MKRFRPKISGKHIIVFQGDPNSGKTTALIELAKLFLPDSDEYIDRRIKLGKRLTADREMIITWCGVRILIRTNGDTKPLVEKNIAWFGGQNYNIAITASHWASSKLTASAKRRMFAVVVHDVLRVKTHDHTKDVCYTTPTELYLRIMNLVRTGTFK